MARMSHTPPPAHFQPVPLDKAYRLINHGPTVLVSSAHAGEINVMSAAWACALDFSPPKVTVVIDKATRTRALVEASGAFALCVPSAALAALTVGVGTDSAATVQGWRPRSRGNKCLSSKIGAKLLR